MKFGSYALLGSSGCGKTTLLSCIVGTKKLDSGSISILNSSVGANKLKIGFMPQDFSVMEEFTIKELIFFFGTIYGLSSRDIQKKFDNLMELFELSDAFLKNCSGGEKRRVSLAICMIHEPEILILGKF